MSDRMCNAGRWIVISAIFFGMIGIVSCKPETSTSGSMVVWTVGDVTLVRGGGQPKPVALKEPLMQGDRLQTGKDSFAVVQVGVKAVIRIQAESVLDMAAISDPKTTEISLGQGQVLSKVAKLGKGESYGVRMPTALAAVRGTEFSVTYRGSEKRVSVKSGTVDVRVKSAEGAEAAQKSVSGGSTLLFDGEITERPIEINEVREIEFVAIVPVLPEPDKADLNSLKIRNEELQKKLKEVEDKIKVSASPQQPRNIQEILTQYRRVDEVVLYSGKVIKGVILKRGEQFEILTPGGTVKVPKSQVRNTRVVQSL